MASIKILEKDYTRSEVFNATDTIVYIPGMLGRDKNGNNMDISEILGKPQLITNLTDFENTIGVLPTIIDEDSSRVEYDKSFIMAKQLVGLGMKVLYEIVGYNGTAVTDEATMRTVLATDSHWEKLLDRSLYNVRFITSGGYNAASINNFAIANRMTFTCSSRGDCVALIDHPITFTEASEVKALFSPSDSSAATVSNGEYGAAFTPWCKFNLTVDLGGIDPEYITDTGSGYWTLPPSFSYLMSYHNMLKNGNANWLASAGASRGEIPNLLEPLAAFGEKACDELQSREEGKVAVNPITFVTPYGYRVYGNRTLKQNIDGLKATSFLNIRNLISDIKKTCFQACRVMAFEQNTDVLWYNLKSKITPLLDRMATNEGIRAYKVSRVNTNEKAKVVGKVRIIPIEAVEDFEITIELVDSLDFEVTTTEE